ncbi:DUF4185 domain-containing protein [Mycobacterium sp. 21AC1]|uniref:DUF4185 domain-containing protein n=1 Tax=[Mycobacterium] appelbergii TaxID=2939269 RepID=UPI0029391431|nr:DUF4185 domain-containing protein [Mycobacterium sp. 21AC1]MDV3128017.1 DUF4185 domain-containing protein [Mycobacterium sp. 21AC1]
MHLSGAVPLRDGKVVDLTGPGLTDRFGVTCTDLGASVIAPNGTLVSVFGDTFSGRRVGRGDWRSPVVLIGTGDADHEIIYERAGGPDPDYARQLWHYVHDDAASGWRRSGISTVIPSDLLRVEDSIYLHAIVNRGFGNVSWTEIWRSDDSGVSWTHLGEQARFPADLHGGHAQCWSWDFDPEDGWVYVAATGFQRDKGIILMRVRPDQIGRRSRYYSWGFTGRRWEWGQRATPITPAAERWGELSFRRMAPGKWVLGGFFASKYALGYRVVASPITNMHTTPVQSPIAGSSWSGENHGKNRVAQLYGGYILPGSRFDIRGGVGLVVSQWHTDSGWPYRAMQFKGHLKDTASTRPPEDPVNL